MERGSTAGAGAGRGAGTRAHRQRNGLAARAGAPVQALAQAAGGLRDRGGSRGKRTGLAPRGTIAVVPEFHRRVGAARSRTHRAGAGDARSLRGPFDASTTDTHGGPASGLARDRRHPPQPTCPAARRHRVGKDARLSGSAARRGRVGARGDPPGAGNRPDAADRRAGARRLWRPCGRAPLGVVRWRARRRVARLAPGRAARGGRPPVRRVRAGAAAGRDRRGRGARAQLQAGVGAALPRPRRRGDARAARRRSPYSRKRDPIAGDAQ